MAQLNPHIRKILIPYHGLALGTVYFFATTSFQFSHLILFFVFWMLIGGLGIEVAFHRTLSHNHSLIRKWPLAIFSLFGTLAFSCSSFFWATIHRSLHHPYADKPQDPHSPQYGLWVSFLGWSNLDLTKTRIGRLPKEMLRDGFQQWLHRNYYKINYVFTGICLLVNHEVYFLAILPAQFAALYQGPVVNVICHLRKFGYRSFETDDNSVNNRWLSFFTWGLALHNNHHKFPQDPCFAKKTFEVDLGYGLAYPFLSRRRQPASVYALNENQEVDREAERKLAVSNS